MIRMRRERARAMAEVKRRLRMNGGERNRSMVRGWILHDWERKSR